MLELARVGRRSRICFDRGATAVFHQTGRCSFSSSVRPVTGEHASRVNLLSLGQEEIRSCMVEWGYPGFRGDQVYKWVQGGVYKFDSMSNLPPALRTELAARATVGSLALAKELVSQDGTRKRAYRCHDGQLIETVLMPYAKQRFTACISSQAGCAMGCVFCATGQMGLSRQLTADEIFEQAARISGTLQRTGHRLSNVVFMGMGEPLANYRNVLKATRRIRDEVRPITMDHTGPYWIVLDNTGCELRCREGSVLRTSSMHLCCHSEAAPTVFSHPSSS